MSKVIALSEADSAMSQEEINKVNDYVNENYKTWKDKPLEVSRVSSSIFVSKAKDSSPMVLSTSILD